MDEWFERAGCGTVQRDDGSYQQRPAHITTRSALVVARHPYPTLTRFDCPSHALTTHNHCMYGSGRTRAAQRTVRAAHCPACAHTTAMQYGRFHSSHLDNTATVLRIAMVRAVDSVLLTTLCCSCMVSTCLPVRRYRTSAFQTTRHCRLPSLHSRQLYVVLATALFSSGIRCHRLLPSVRCGPDFRCLYRLLSDLQCSCCLHSLRLLPVVVSRLPSRPEAPHPQLANDGQKLPLWQRTAWRQMRGGRKSGWQRVRRIGRLQPGSCATQQQQQQ